MIHISWIQFSIYLVVLITLAKPLGTYMAHIYEGNIPGPVRWLSGIEKTIYKLTGQHASEEMSWKHYALAMLAFNIAGFLFLYLLQRVQGALPLNPQHLGAVTADSSFNTAVSFATNTNWQGYGGEYTMSYLTQMVGLGVQNFVSAATGMAVLVALIRGFARKQVETIGNFWVDLVRSTLYILLPLAVIWSVVLVSQGVPQTFKPSITASVLQPTKDANGQLLSEQTIAVGPVASQIAIKQLGTNGGGYYNANSAHPLENPTPLSNFSEVLAILLIPAALCYTFGLMVRDRRQGWALLVTMTIIFVAFLTFCYTNESRPNPLIAQLGVSQPTGNMEGKETRFGVGESVLWATATTSASNGSVNSMHDSFMPLGGLVPLVMMLFGEVIFGGVGSGLYGMLAFVIVAVFVAGLMVGRTPEYLGKKIESFEMKMALVALLITPLFVLVLTALAVMTPGGKATIYNTGMHGFSEVLYAFSSGTNNNGSAFAGLGANNPFYNITLGLAMFFGRYWIIIPILAMAGSLARKQKVPASAGTLATHTPLFIGWLIATIILLVVLNYLPALALGPVVEHLMLNQGVTF